MTDCDEKRDERRIPFAMVEVPVLRDPTVSPQCKALYALLISYGPGRIFPSHETLANCLGVKRRAIVRWLQELRGHGLIDWVNTGRSNRYRIIGPRCVPKDTSDVYQSAHQICAPEHIRCAPQETRSRSIYPDPSIQRDMAATAALASPSLPVSSQSETDGNGAKPRNRLKQKAKGKTLPAVDAFRQATHRYPPKSWYSDIAQAVGDDDADLVFWHDVCKAYVGRGWNPLNVQAMLEYYGRREIPGRGGPPAGNGNGRHGAGQRRGRGEYQSYTTSERDALWARYKDRYLALVGQGLDPNRHCSDIAKALGLTREEGHILHTGYSAWVSMQESHVDLSFLERV